MKKTVLLGFLLAGACSSALAQNNVIKVNIFSPVVKTGSFFFEHKLTDNSSAQLGLLFTSASIDELDVSGFAITPEYRFYLSEKTTALEGFYVGPYLRYQNLTLKENYNGQEDEATLNSFGGGVVVGRHWIFKERFSLDAFLGPAYNSGDIKVKSAGSDPESFDPGPLTGFGVRTGVTFGIAF